MRSGLRTLAVDAHLEGLSAALFEVVDCETQAVERLQGLL